MVASCGSSNFSLLLVGPFLGLPYRILNINHEKELLRGLWVGQLKLYLAFGSPVLLTAVENATIVDCPCLRIHGYDCRALLGQSGKERQQLVFLQGGDPNII